MSVTIRPERAGDFGAIAAVVEAAFGSAVEARLVELIRASPNYVPELALVAVEDDRVVGHTMLSRTTIEDVDARHVVLTLSPLAVLPERQRNGIGAALVRRAVERADQLGEPLVCLEGSPRYYGGLGFEDARDHGIVFALPDWAPPNAGQIFRLRNYDPTVRGRVVYPEAFAVVEQLRDTQP